MSKAPDGVGNFYNDMAAEQGGAGGGCAPSSAYHISPLVTVRYTAIQFAIIYKRIVHKD